MFSTLSSLIRKDVTYVPILLYVRTSHVPLYVWPDNLVRARTARDEKSLPNQNTHFLPRCPSCPAARKPSPYSGNMRAPEHARHVSPNHTDPHFSHSSNMIRLFSFNCPSTIRLHCLVEHESPHPTLVPALVGSILTRRRPPSPLSWYAHLAATMTRPTTRTTGTRISTPRTTDEANPYRPVVRMRLRHYLPRLPELAQRPARVAHHEWTHMCAVHAAAACLACVRCSVCALAAASRVVCVLSLQVCYIADLCASVHA